MAEPLTALATFGTISNFLQILDFSVKVAHQTKQIVDSVQGATADAQRTEKLAEQYRNLSLKVFEEDDFSRPLTADEAALEDLACQSRDEAAKLLELMGALKLNDGRRGVKRTWHGARKVIKSIAHKAEIELQRTNLLALNGQIGSMLLCLLKDSLKSDQAELLSRIDTQAASTVDKILDMKQELLHAIGQHRHREKGIARGIIDSLSFPDMESRRNNISEAYGETYEWVFTETSWGYKDWLVGDQRLLWISGKAGSGKSTLMKFITTHSETHRHLQSWANEGETLVVADFYFCYLGSPLQKSIQGLLQSILYQILSKCPYLLPHVCSNRWKKGALGSDLPRWRPSDAKAAGQVDGQEELYEAYSSALPWTEEELFRVLEDVANVSFSNADDGKNVASDGANKLRTSARLSSHKFCFFIDALDEYSGDHGRIINHIKKLTRNPSFKICVSSRPWNIFNHAFSANSTRLRLEQLTMLDIYEFVSGSINDALFEYQYTYYDQPRTNRHSEPRSRGAEGADELDPLEVSDDLEKFPSFVTRQGASSGASDIRLINNNEKPTDILIAKVVEKASGVFLWVYLVVTSLVKGIAEGDSVTVLSKRVDAFPRDLYEYFKHILERVEDIYARQTAHALLTAKLIADGNLEKTGPHASSFLTYWLLKQGEDNVSSALNSDIMHVSPSRIWEMKIETQKFLSACCKDLLQVSHVEPILANGGVIRHWISRYPVEFLHRTVYEFLQSDYVQVLFDKLNTSPFQDQRFWCRMSLARLRIVPEVQHDNWCLCSHFYEQACHAVGDLPSFVHDSSRRNLVRELDSLAPYWLQHPCSKSCQHYLGYASEATFLYYFLAAYQMTETLTFLSHRETWRPCKDQYEVQGSARENPQSTALLFSVLGISSIRQFPITAVDLALLSNLLNRGADPNKTLRSPDSKLTYTVWQELLVQLIRRQMKDSETQKPIVPSTDEIQQLNESMRLVIMLLVEFGADLECMVPNGDSQISARAALEKLGVDRRVYQHPPVTFREVDRTALIYSNEPVQSCRQILPFGRSFAVQWPPPMEPRENSDRHQTHNWS